MTQAFDTAVIGDGVNGVGIARDAAGRGLKVLLVQRGDLACATSSAWTKPIHGGLRYREHRAFGLVRHAVAEREVLWAMAPHIIWPMRFVLPHHRTCDPHGCCAQAFFSMTTSAGAVGSLPLAAAVGS